MCSPRCADVALIRGTGKGLDSMLIGRLNGIKPRAEVDRIDMVRLMRLDRVVCFAAQVFYGDPMIEWRVGGWLKRA